MGITNDQRDRMLLEIHGDVKVIRTTQENHGTTLYGTDGNGGIVKDTTLLKERQNQCVARKAATTEGKRLSLGKIMVVIGIITLTLNLILAYYQFKS